MAGGSLDSEAIVVARRGGPERMALRSVSVPEPGPGCVRVRMLAAGVAYADLMIREGLYPIEEPWPRVLGYDIVGEVEATGPDVPAELGVGTRVAALTVVGSYARHRILPAAWCVPIPDGVEPASAVALVLNYLTAYQMMHRLAQLQAGDTILIHAAAGGVGTAILELARLAGVRVIGLCAPPKHTLIESLGGIPIDYDARDLEAKVKSLTQGQGVDAVLDSIGGGELRRSYRMLRTTGLVVSFGMLGMSPRGRTSLQALLRTVLQTPWFSPISLFQQSKGVAGYHVDKWRNQRENAYRADLTHLLHELRLGRLRPHIAEQVALPDAARAQTLLGQGAVLGKLVLINR